MQAKQLALQAIESTVSRQMPAKLFTLRKLVCNLKLISECRQAGLGPSSRQVSGRAGGVPGLLGLHIVRP